MFFYRFILVSIVRTLAAFAISGFAFLSEFGGQSRALACGIDWVVPSNHFSNINEQGEFSYWLAAGTVDLGDGLKVPLTIGFKPARGGNSWLGPGWLVPLLESNVIQVDEKKFLLTQPDGITRRFWRKTETDTMLEGQGNWAGVIKDTTITLWADCGWKLVFTKGKLTSMTTPKNRTLNILYANGRPVEIQEQGRVFLRVEKDSLSGITGLTFGQNRILFKMGERPRVDVVRGTGYNENGTNVIGGVLPTLQILTFSKFGPPAGQHIRYEFSVDEKVQPMLHIEEISEKSNKKNEQIFTWNASTGHLVKDGEWNYDLKPGRNRWKNVETTRTNAEGQREIWFKDTVTGQEIVEGIDGVRYVTYTFVSGVLKGEVRKKEKIFQGKSKVLLQSIYDESGNLLRTTKEDGSMIAYNYDAFGNQTALIENGKTRWQRTYDKNGLLVEEIKEYGEKIEQKRLANGDIEKTIYSNGVKIVQNIRHGKLINMIHPNGMTVYFRYDKNGAISEQIEGDVVWQYIYGENGEIAEQYKNGILLYKMFKNQNEKDRIKITYSQKGTPLELHNITSGEKISGERSFLVLDQLIPIKPR